MSRFALLLSLLLSHLLCPVVAGAEDERVLLLDNGVDEYRLGVDELVDRFGLRTLELDDIQYRASHRYSGIELAALLDFAGFAPGDQLLLICIDGYSIPFDSAALLDPAWRGLLALHDEDARDGRWQPFGSGDEPIDFDPFYLVWQRSDAEAVSDWQAEALPWPWQLVEIRKLQPEDFAAAMPDGDAPGSVLAGFGLFYKHCIKCHGVNGAGGTLGPPLDKGGLVPGLAQLGLLKGTIRDIRGRFPDSRMPVFAATLDDAELENIMSYLRSMQQQP